LAKDEDDECADRGADCEAAGDVGGVVDADVDACEGEE
jgi:hypothetical protein